MEPRIFHGKLTPQDIAQALIARFNHGNMSAQQVGSGAKISVQVATHRASRSGGKTAVTINLQKIEDGVSVMIGQQAWLGVAASLGATALSAIRNPFNLLGRLDDLAQDIENIQLSEQVWQAVENVARTAGASHELSERLKRYVCIYCNTPNPPGEPSCLACGAPLGDIQPKTCSNCGFVVKNTESICPNCKRLLK